QERCPHQDAPLMDTFEFPVVTYPSGIRPSRIARPIAPFLISDARLLFATVRSMLSTRAPAPVRKYLASTMVPAMQFFVDVHRAPNFAVDIPRVAYLRDFSLTSRVGEFAQGIA